MPEPISEYVPQVFADGESARRARGAWVVWGAVLAAAAALVAMIVSAPLLRARGAGALSFVFYQFFHVACHQMPERSFHVAGHPFAVCARCTGLYAGALAGVAAYPLLRRLTRRDAPERVWLLLAAVPTAIDFALGFFGVWENTHWSRFSTALLLGAASAFYIVPGLVELFGRGFVWPSRAGGRRGGLEKVDPSLRASRG